MLHGDVARDDRCGQCAIHGKDAIQYHVAKIVAQHLEPCGADFEAEIAELQGAGLCSSGQVYGVALAVFEVKGIDLHRFGNKRHVRIAIPISNTGRGNIERGALQVDEAIEDWIVGSSFHSHVELRRAHDILNAPASE